jgi:hypothetical protein
MQAPCRTEKLLPIAGTRSSPPGEPDSEVGALFGHAAPSNDVGCQTLHLDETEIAGDVRNSVEIGEKPMSYGQPFRKFLSGPVGYTLRLAEAGHASGLPLKALPSRR